MNLSAWHLFFDSHFPSAVKVQVFNSSTDVPTTITCAGVYMVGFDGRPNIKFGDSHGLKSFDLWIESHKILRNSDPFVVEFKTSSDKYIFSDFVSEKMQQYLKPAHEAQLASMRRIQE